MRFSRELKLRFPERLDSFDQFEGDIAEWIARFERGEKIALGANRLFAHHGDNTARRLVASQATNIAGRVVSLSEGLAELLNSDNAHSAPAVARALYETCGVATYLRRNLTPLLVKNRPERAKVLLMRVGTGTDPGTQWGDVRPIRVSSLIQSVAQEADDRSTSDGEGNFGATLRRLYSALSDSAHPNASATNLGMTLSDTLAPTWTMRAPVGDFMLSTCIGTCHLAMHFGGEAWDAVVKTAQQHRVVLP